MAARGIAGTALRRPVRAARRRGHAGADAGGWLPTCPWRRGPASRGSSRAATSLARRAGPRALGAAARHRRRQLGRALTLSGADRRCCLAGAGGGRRSARQHWPSPSCAVVTATAASRASRRAAACSLGGPIALHFDARGALSKPARGAAAESATRRSGRRGEAVRVRRGRPQLPRRAQRARCVPRRPGPAGRRLCCAWWLPLAQASRTCRLAARCSATAWRRSPPCPRDARLLAAIGESLSFEQACTLPTTWSTVHMSLLAARPRLGHGCCCTRARAASAWRLASTPLARLRASATVGRPHKHRYLHQLGLAAARSARATAAPSRSALAKLLRSGGCASCSTACRRTSSRARSRCSARTAACARSASAAVWSYERHEAACALAYDASRSTRRWSRRRGGCAARCGAVVRARRRSCCTACRCELFDLESERRWPPSARCRRLQHRQGGGPHPGRPRRRRARARTCCRAAAGGLGLVTGWWLGEGGASAVVLASRGGSVAARTARSCGRSASAGARGACDAAELTDSARWSAPSWRAAAGGRVARGGRAVGRAAARQTAASLRRVYAPKACGAWALQRACAASPLDACVLFSSMAALIGGGGQANYAAANCCLDALGGLRRRARPGGGERAVGPVGGRRHGGGRRGERAAAGRRDRPDRAGAGRRRLQAALLPACPSSMALFRCSWAKFLGTMPAVPPLLAPLPRATEADRRGGSRRAHGDDSGGGAGAVMRGCSADDGRQRSTATRR